MSFFNIVAESNDSTVVTEYVPVVKKSDSYESETELEKQFINILSQQGYNYLNISTENDLIANLRNKLEKLNNFSFSDKEWDIFFISCIANKNEGIVEKTRKIQEDYVQILKRDNGTTKNIYLIDKNNIHNNYLDVINQYTTTGNYQNRYDVTILVNGLPLVHIELKRRGVNLREAFNQINRYQNDSFWSGSALFEYIQIFVISNGTYTKYYSNTTRISHIKENIESERNKSKKTSNSYEFTSFWADANNKVIPDLVDFTKTFFAKHSLLNVLTKYCVFTSENMLLVMRPYQIVATERILSRIEISTNYKKTATVDAGGYIWHTTGSGKTLTSFKTAQLATKISGIEKVLFVVDRKDLDYQTMKEYDRFEKGAANSNKSTAVLSRQLDDENCKIIITTIQKLDSFISKNKEHSVYKKHVVLVFDECHRSQFGEMHLKIIKHFKNYHIFGFTGTPIFAKNATNKKRPDMCTTEQAFGDKLHTYTIVDAINDGNVLPFRIDYVNTVNEKSDIFDNDVHSIDREKALMADDRISKIVSYILEHYDTKTKSNSFYNLHGNRLGGFNSIFAVQSIPMLMKYYNEFKKQLKINKRKLTIATIFSFSPNEEDPNDIIVDEDFDTDSLDRTSRDFLEMAISDYNETFKTKFDTTSDKFQNYYKDLSDKVKKRQVDILIVVNMFLTGFDATTLNTLWVDKNLKYHGLIQAFSRTNRILNSVKTFGNIVCFRNLEQQTNDALALFGDKKAQGVVLLKSFENYYYGYDENGKHFSGYSEIVEKLEDKFPLSNKIFGENNEKEFIKEYGTLLKSKNILSCFDRFMGLEILSEREFQDYQSVYIDLYEKYRGQDKADKEDINEDLVFEVELIKQVEINIDYIIMLVAKYHDSNCKNKEIITDIQKAVSSSIMLRSKKDLIDEFIYSINVDSKVEEDWKKYITGKKEEELTEIIKEENLKEIETRKYIDNAFKYGSLKTIGTDIDNIMPPISRFGGNRGNKKQTIIDKLKKFFERFFGIS